MAYGGGPLRADEIRVLRQMMSEYTQQQAVERWLGAKWRTIVAVVATVSAGTVIAASCIEIVRTIL